MSKTIEKTINLFDTIKECGYDDSKKTKLNKFVISIVFRTLLLVDAFHDFGDNERYKIDGYKIQKSDLLEIYKELLNSYKKDLLYIFKLCEKGDDFINFFTQLFENLIHEILLKIECKNSDNPHFLTINVNKIESKLNKEIGINARMKNPENIREKIFTHLTFNEELTDSDFSKYSYSAPGNPLKKIGIATDIMLEKPLALFDTLMQITKDKTNEKFVIKKFIGKLRLNPDNLNELLDYSIKPIFIISYDNKKEFKISDQSVLTKIILIINEIFTGCTKKQRILETSFIDISIPNLHKARDDLMEILDFTKKNKISHPEIETSPWGFVHNIICSKTNKFQSSKCRNNINPSITFTIDAESQHSAKDYIIKKLQKFCQDQLCSSPENLEYIEIQRKLINETSELIKNQHKKLSHDSEVSQEGKKLNYIMQSIYDRVINEQTKFKLATTTASNFDAANVGNLGAYIEHHNQSFGIKHEKSHTYKYDITLIVDDKLGKKPLTLLHLIYTPVSVEKSVTVNSLTIPITLNFVKLQIETWFSLTNQTKTHQVLLNYQGTESLSPKNKKDKAEAAIQKLPEYINSEGKGGFSLSKAAKAFQTENNVLDLHFKTATDTGQNLCLKALEMEEQDEENTLYILHTNDTFNGALGSLINPGTVIERTNELERIKAQDGELEKKIDTLSDGKNNMYVTSTTYASAYAKANMFDKIKDEKTLLAKKLLETNQEMKKEQQRAVIAEADRSEQRKRASQERQAKEAETKRADDAVIAKKAAETERDNQAFKRAQFVAKEAADKLTEQLNKVQDTSDEKDLKQLFWNQLQNESNPAKEESPRTKLFGPPNSPPKKRTRSRSKSSSQSTSPTRKKRRTRRSSSRSPAQSRSPNSNGSNRPSTKRPRRYSPNASGKKTKRKKKK